MGCADGLFSIKPCFSHGAVLEGTFHIRTARNPRSIESGSPLRGTNTYSRHGVKVRGVLFHTARE